MGAMTKLMAVNRILRAASEYPINSLTADGVNDSNVAESLLEETSIQAQLEGLNCNTYQTTLHPDTNGYIYLPERTLFVDSAGMDTPKNIVERDGRLFNADDNTDVFTSSVVVDLCVYLDFTALPTSQQFAITDQAARIYQMLTVGDRSSDALLNEMSKLSRAIARGEDMASRDSNLLYGSSSLNARSAVNRRSGYRLGSSTNPRIPN